jgi:hypothetical protein
MSTPQEKNAETSLHLKEQEIALANLKRYFEIVLQIFIRTRGQSTSDQHL